MPQANMNMPKKKSDAASPPRALVWLVVGMGLALIGGSALLVGKIINKSSPSCELERLSLPAGARIIGAGDKQLYILTRAGEDKKQRLQRYDLCRGTLMRELVVDYVGDDEEEQAR